jgi:hypothetical protein
MFSAAPAMRSGRTSKFIGRKKAQKAQKDQTDFVRSAPFCG